MALPGLPASKRKINQRAVSEGWADRVDADGQSMARKRVGARGGAIEYHVDVLPPAARAAIVGLGIADKADVHEAPDTDSARVWRHYERATEAGRAKARQRLNAVMAVEEYEARGMARSAALTMVAARFGVGESTLWEWLTLTDGVNPADRLAHLTPLRAGGGAKAEIDEGAWEAFISDWLRPEKPTVSSCYRRLKIRYADPRGIILPHERAFRRRIESDIPARIIALLRDGEEALRRTLPPLRRSVADYEAMEIVNIDGHKWDVRVEWPDGTRDRPMMVAIQDIVTRKVLAWSIGRSESVIETRLALYRLFATYGIPKVLFSDNGRAFASKALTGGSKSRFRGRIRPEDPIGLLNALNIDVRFTLPYRGQSKPIERAFRDFCSDIAKDPALSGAYTGNRPDAKPENYGARTIPIDEFRAIVEAGIAEHNARPGRDTERCRGVKSFDQVFAESYAVADISKASAVQLRMAMLAVDNRPTHRNNGSITLFGNRYWCDELAEIAGDKVTVRFDPDDLHAPIHVFALAGEFICTAPVFEDAGFMDVAAAQARAKLEKNLRKTTARQVEAERLLDADKLAGIYGRSAPAEVPEAGVIRPVRVNGPTVTQLKPRQQARPAESQATIDQVAAGLRKLRAVD